MYVFKKEKNFYLVCFSLVSIREFGYGILILEINIFFFDLDE